MTISAVPCNFLPQLNEALLAAGFSSFDLDRALNSRVVVERATRCDGPSLTTTIGVNPNGAFISFNFDGIVKHGASFRYPDVDADCETIANFIYDLIGAAASADKS